jgi:ABC-type dipeptide/oligopeptide/nickel transport system ATPase component
MTAPVPTTVAQPGSPAADDVAGRDAILSIRGLTGGFGTGEAYRQVLDHVTFEVRRCRLTAVVGETGSGKSITALSVLRIQPPAFVVTGGSIAWGGLDLLTCGPRELRTVRGRQISMVFQDARAALNPVLRVGDQLAAVHRRHHGSRRAEARAAAEEALRSVQIPEPARRARQYPHEFSGGMAQRVMIAMALLCRPDLLVLDEPTTGLDVTIQADIMQLVTELVRDQGLSTLLITHDLGVVAETADDVVVMRHGQVVETGTTEQVFLTPAHPYTRDLLASSKLGGRIR